MTHRFGLDFIHGLEKEGVPRAAAEAIAIGFDREEPSFDPARFIHRLEHGGLSRGAASVLAEMVALQREIWAEDAAAARRH